MSHSKMSNTSPVRRIDYALTPNSQRKGHGVRFQLLEFLSSAESEGADTSARASSTPAAVVRRVVALANRQCYLIFMLGYV